jgi:hypothetical protein
LVSIPKLVLYGVVGAFALSALINPARAYATTQAFGGIGSALGSLGQGALSLGTGVGTGIAKLFNPLFTLRDLIYGPQAGNQVTSDVRELTSTGNTTNPVLQSETIQQNPELTSSGFRYNINRAISPVPVAQAKIGWSSGTTAMAPLSAAAVKYYQSIGVSVTPSNTQTVQEQNSSNATSPNSPSSQNTATNYTNRPTKSGGVSSFTRG